MTTIGRHWRARRSGGDYTAKCSYCGVHFPRSQLHKDAMGFLVCDAEGYGKDQLTLDRLNAEGARDASFRNRYRIDGGVETYVADAAPPYEAWLGHDGSFSPVAIPPPVGSTTPTTGVPTDAVTWRGDPLTWRGEFLTWR